MSLSVRRHDLLRIDPASWQQMLCLRPQLAADERIARWADNGWPVMVRRYLSTDRPNQVPVAISLPPAPFKAGAALQFAAHQIGARLPALSLRRGLCSAPHGWAGTLRTLLDIGECFDSEAALFGSLLWQTLTGARYINERSDLDLLWPVSRHAQALGLGRAIAACADSSPMRIDGEFILPDGAAVNWREFLNASEVMVKTLHRVECRAVRSLFGDTSGTAAIAANA